MVRKKELGRKQRKVAISNLLPQYYLIICEGEQTEKNYFEGIKKRIKAKLNNDRIEVNIRVEGTGRNTLSLLNYAEEFARKSFNPIGIVWLVYDKDDFPADDYDNTQYRAESLSNDELSFNTAWSNQCIELWFLLHFIDNKSDLHRSVYNTKLNEHFRKAGLSGYQKNMENIFEILCDNGNLIKAIERAKGLYSEGLTPSKMAPATRVHELVQELMPYFKD